MDLGLLGLPSNERSYGLAHDTQSPEQGGGCRCLPNHLDRLWFSLHQLRFCPPKPIAWNRCGVFSPPRPATRPPLGVGGIPRPLSRSECAALSREARRPAPDRAELQLGEAGLAGCGTGGARAQARGASQAAATAAFAGDAAAHRRQPASLVPRRALV